MTAPPPVPARAASTASTTSAPIEPLTIGLSSNTSGLPALFSGGVPVTYSVVGNVLTASAGAGNTVFTLTVNANGSWTFDLVRQLDHPAGNNENNLFIDFSSMITARDFDNDPAPPLPGGSFVINVDDDIPVAVDDTDQVLEGASTNGNVLTGVGGDGIPAGADLPGADGFAANTVVGVVHSSNDTVDTNSPALPSASESSAPTER